MGNPFPNRYFASVIFVSLIMLSRLRDRYSLFDPALLQNFLVSRYDSLKIFRTLIQCYYTFNIGFVLLLARAGPAVF